MLFRHSNGNAQCLTSCVSYSFETAAHLYCLVNIAVYDHSKTMLFSLFTSKVSKGYRPTSDAKTSFSWDSSSLSCACVPHYHFPVIISSLLHRLYMNQKR